MKVFHFDGETECKSLGELNDVLNSKHNNCNEFELRVDDEYPYMTILVNDKWACVHFFQDEEDCGHYASYIFTNENILNEDDYTTFYMGSSLTSETEISNKLVIPFRLALIAAQDFFLNEKMSEKLEWFEL